MFGKLTGLNISQCMPSGAVVGRGGQGVTATPPIDSMSDILLLCQKFCI